MSMLSNRASLLTRLFAAPLLLLGAAAVNVAWAEDAAPVSNRSEPVSPVHEGGQSQPGRVDGGDNATGGTIDTNTSVKGAAGTLGKTGTSENEKVNSRQGVTDRGDDSVEKTPDHRATAKGTSGEGEVDSKGIRHGAGGADAKSGKIDPIDTRITVLGKPRFGRSRGTQSLNKFKIVRPAAKLPNSHRPSRPAANIGSVRNAIGQPVRQANTEITRTDVKASGQGAVDTKPRDTGPEGISGADTTPHPQGFVPLRAGGVTSRDPQINTATNRSVINGRDMVRSGSTASAIGGAAKNFAGGVNGTGFHPRHP
jgi:hypothetical protein